MAIKRGKGQRLIPLDELRADDRIDIEPADQMTAEMIYERRWALTVLERVLSRLKDEYHSAGNAALFDSLKELLPDEPGSPSQAEIAVRLGMTENAVRQAFYRFRQRFQAYCARRLPTPWRHRATSKMSCAISSPCLRRPEDTKARHELSRSFEDFGQFVQISEIRVSISLSW